MWMTGVNTEFWVQLTKFKLCRSSVVLSEELLFPGSTLHPSAGDHCGIVPVFGANHHRPITKIFLCPLVYWARDYFIRAVSVLQVPTQMDE
jgi:hypothetical protein